MAAEILNTLRKVSEIIATTDDYHKALTESVKLIACEFEVNVCSIYEYSESEGKLVLIASCGLAQDSVGKVKLPVGKGLTGWCFEKKEIVNVANAQSDPHFVYFSNTGEERYKSFLASPLNAGGRSIGVITLQRFRKQEFDEITKDALVSLSAQLANLIVNARMLRKLSVPQQKGKAVSRRQSILSGEPIVNGIAFGRCSVFRRKDIFSDIEHTTHSNEKTELALFRGALKRARETTLKLEEQALSVLSEADASIFDSHLLFLEDKTLLNAIRDEITEEQHSLEFGILNVYRRFEKRFQGLPDEIFRERLADFKDVTIRLLESVREIRERKKRSGRSVAAGNGSIILAAYELLPSDLLKISVENVKGIICEHGNFSSHVAILARAFNIPCIMQLDGLLETLSANRRVIVDAYAGTVYVNPSSQVSEKYKQLLKGGKDSVDNADYPAVTADGQRLTVRANLSLICELPLLEKFHADGVGLYRTEFIFMARDYMPGELTQIKVYEKIFSSSNGPVNVRVLDAGSDKPIPALSLRNEANPALGLRGIRLLLSNRGLFKTHLRSILRAAVGMREELIITLPMVSEFKEIFQAKRIMAEVEDSLRRQGIEFNPDYKVGVMFEVPALFFDLDAVLKEVDLVSIGSNDLQQYFFAFDRGNSHNRSHAYVHPSFLRLLKDICDKIRQYPDKKVSICGEMAGDPLAVPLLMGCGINEFSMAPALIPQVKRSLRKFTIGESQKILNKALKMKDPKDVVQLVRSHYNKKSADSRELK